jgi:hypothetical protein
MQSCYVLQEISLNYTALHCIRQFKGRGMYGVSMLSAFVVSQCVRIKDGMNETRSRACMHEMDSLQLL